MSFLFVSKTRKTKNKQHIYANIHMNDHPKHKNMQDKYKTNQEQYTTTKHNKQKHKQH